MSKTVEQLAEEWVNKEWPYKMRAETETEFLYEALMLTRHCGTVGFIAGHNSALPKWQKLTPENAPSDRERYIVKGKFLNPGVAYADDLPEKTYDKWGGCHWDHFAEIVWPVDEEGE